MPFVPYFSILADFQESGAKVTDFIQQVVLVIQKESESIIHLIVAYQLKKLSF